MKKKYAVLALAAAVMINTFGITSPNTLAKTLVQKTLDFEKTAEEAGFIASDYSDCVAEENGNHVISVSNKTNAVKLEFADENGSKTVLTDGGEISIKFDVKFANKALSKATLLPSFTDADGNIIDDELCAFQLNLGYLTLTGSAEGRVQGKQDTLYNVEYIIDKKAMTYTVKVDEEEKFSGDLNNAPKSVGGLDSITVTGGKSKTVTFDNFVITLSDSEQDPDQPTVSPEPTEDPEQDEELFYNYDFSNDTVGKVPSGDGITYNVNNSSISVDDYFRVVEHEGLDGKTSKMLRIKNDASLTYTNFNFIKFMFPENAESPILEYSYDVMAIAEDHIAISLGMFDYYYDDNNNIVRMSKWGQPTFGMQGRYIQNWYCKTKDGSAPQFTAGKGVWTNIRFIVNTVTNTMSVYHDGIEVSNAINAKPERFDTSSENDRNIDGWEGFMITCPKDHKTDSEFYYDNIKIYKRTPIEFTAEQSEKDVSVSGAELSFKTNREVSSISDPIVKDANGNNIDKKTYSVESDSNGFTISFKSGALDKKAKYTVNVDSAYDSNKIGLVDKFVYEFTTEPEDYDVTYKITSGENEIDSLVGLGGQTLSICAKNRNYNTAQEKEYITFAVLTDPKGKMISVKTVGSGSLKNGEEADKTVDFILPDGDLTGYELRIMTWDSMLKGNKLFKSLLIK